MMKKIFGLYMQHVRGRRYSFLISVIASPLAWLNGLVVIMLDFLRSHGFLKVNEPPLPLISVGNLTYGGTNKTPFVEMLALYMQDKGLKSGVVTRGYTGKSHKVILIKHGEGERNLTGDEPLLLSRKLEDAPVAVAKKRIEGVKALKKCGCEIVIADDAFQHKSLGRDVDIVLIDSSCPFGSGKLIPNGILREKLKALCRADLVVLTKSDQISNEDLKKLREAVKQYVAPEKIFTSRLESDGWILLNSGEKTENTSSMTGLRVFAFSAIGSPESFTRSLERSGLTITAQKNFKDHHQYTFSDLESLSRSADEHKAEALACTEKDLYNIPKGWVPKIPLVIPKVKVILDEPESFFDLLIQCLHQRIVVASNGYGEDAIGVVLAEKLRKRFPKSEILSFPLVGRGDAYLKSGFEVKSTSSITPSGGVLKYSFKDLWGDMKAGLLRHVRAQLRDWKKLAGKIRTPICVGDVYLLSHTIWGSGARPLFAATAKTVYLSGHWRLERAVINKFTLRTWARDEESAKQLGKKAVYSGNPVMDLLYEGGEIFSASDFNNRTSMNPLILLLPGSRLRACKDVKLLLDAALLIVSSKVKSEFRMLLAPTLPVNNFFESCKSYGWDYSLSFTDAVPTGGELSKNNIKISLTFGSIASAASGVKILIGFGGTANQLCAGLGIPVISIDEKGKRVQKKLLGDAEILVPANAKELALCAMRVIDDHELYSSMSKAGRERMGRPGALDDIVQYAGENLGWDIRENVYGKLKH